MSPTKTAKTLFIRTLTIGFVLTGGAWTPPAHADIARPALKSDSKLWLVGDSTLHAYTSTASVLKVDVQVEPAAADKTLYDAVMKGRMKSLETDIPVVEMKSGKSQLDKNLQKALKSKEHPSIHFRMTSYSVEGSTGVKAVGLLSVAGVEKNVDLEATATNEDGNIRLEGTKDLLMTDYGVKPPTVMGMIRTHDRVVVHFDLVLTAGER